LAKGKGLNHIKKAPTEMISAEAFFESMLKENYR
jgi:hypothetical protein